MKLPALLAVVGLSSISVAQSLPLALPQSNTFNTSFQSPSLSSINAILSSSSLSNATQSAVRVALDFERSNWAGLSARFDPFYTSLPANTSSSSPGSLLKLEAQTNTTLYTLPPNVALSRIVFQSATANGTSVPSSAFVLWPWLPRHFSTQGLPIVAWAHGTSGWSAECAPSHIRNLWYQYSAPFTLALQGYVAVAPDYTGLGVGKDAENRTIRHQYNVHQAAANDLVYSVQAAQAAFPELGKEFVVIGHSQGGGAAWAAAQMQAESPREGYLGTVAGSPVTNRLTELGFEGLAPVVAQGLDSVYPDFEPGDWLSEEGVKRTSLLQDLQACQSTKLELLGSVDAGSLINPAYNESWYWDTYLNFSRVGGLPIGPEPMLVLQGTDDSSVPAATVDLGVNETCAAYPESNIEYARFEGVEHVPALFASQRIWLDFIEDLFRGRRLDYGYQKTQTGCTTRTYQPFFEVERYQKQLAYFLQWPQYAYEIA
ncbi:Hypothetical protein D9617_5g067630 [Elsinoe fawcettii]|nr:Hypothetical protein D9617_5g067630 [Elsinoe fawcettii]